jgi:adenine-specific DNA-methyltransferase
MGVGSSLVAAVLHHRRAFGSEILAEYHQIAVNRIHQAETGELRIRPMERPVFDPSNPTNIPPKRASIDDTPLFEVLKSASGS